MNNSNQINPKEVENFLNEFCDEVYDMPTHDLELKMDDHKCVVWNDIQYFVPEHCSLWNERENQIYEYLEENHLY